MWRFCVFLAVVVAVTVAEDCADFASFNIQILGKTKVRKPDVMESLQKVRTKISDSSCAEILNTKSAQTHVNEK